MGWQVFYFLKSNSNFKYQSLDFFSECQQTQENNFESSFSKQFLSKSHFPAIFQKLWKTNLSKFVNEKKKKENKPKSF